MQAGGTVMKLIRTMQVALLAVLALIGQATVAAAGDWSTIRIGTEGAYKPFNYYDSAGHLQGFDIDLAQALCDRVGAKCEFVAIQFDGIVQALLDGKIDA